MSRRCVVLIGMMGAGKTEVGELLADQIGYDFIDLDSKIVEKTGKSIAKIFKEEGEPHFRDLESQLIQELKGAQSQVISVGGGAPVDPENRRVLQSLGLVVYLKASPRELYQRVKNDTSRPLLQVDNPVDVVKKLLADRQFAYDQADVTIDTELLSVDEVVDKLIDELARRTIETQVE